MEKVVKKSKVLVTVLTIGTIGTVIYFLLLKDIFFGKSRDEVSSAEVDWSRYKGRDDFTGDNGEVVRGFPLPDDINVVDWKNGVIIITKPNSTVFGIPMNRNMLKVYRDGNDIIYSGRLNGEFNDFKEDYSTIKDSIIFATNDNLIVKNDNE